MNSEIDMPMVKKSAGMLKEFSANDQKYSFYYLPDPDEIAGSSVFTFEDEESVRKAFWYPNIKKGDVILDIGASFGSYTLSALAMDAIVYSFCPEHEFPKIKKSIEENSGFKQRCQVYNFGLHSKNGIFKTDTARFFEDGKITTKEMENMTKIGPAGWYIPVKKLDDFIPTLNLPKIDFIKIDAEGAEVEILRGGTEILKQFKPKLLVEYHLFKDLQLENKGNAILRELEYKTVGKAESPLIKVSHLFYVPGVPTTEAASE